MGDAPYGLDLVSKGCIGNSNDNRVKAISEVRKSAKQCIATLCSIYLLRCQIQILEGV